MRSKLQIEPNGYYCEQCNEYNDILRGFCIHCNFHRPLVLNQHAINVRFNRNPNRLQDFILMSPHDSDKIELHAKFFNHERVLVRDMDNNALRLHREELAVIIFEGRARLNAIDEEERERKNKLSSDGKSWLVSSEGNTGSDALNAPKERQKRMSKGDKLKEAMTSLGLDLAEVNSLMKPVENQSTTKQVNSITFNSTKEKVITQSEFCRIDRHSECVGRFRTDGESKACDCNCHKVVVEIEEPEFNPAKLFG